MKNAAAAAKLLLEKLVVGTPPPAPPWDGVERRTGSADRRANAHERRWETCRGRRFRLSDRRKNSSNARFRK